MSSSLDIPSLDLPKSRDVRHDRSREVSTSTPSIEVAPSGTIHQALHPLCRGSKFIMLVLRGLSRLVGVIFVIVLSICIVLGMSSLTAIFFGGLISFSHLQSLLKVPPST